MDDSRARCSPVSEGSAPAYSPITLEIADGLRQIVGEKYVLYGDGEALEPYSHDEVAEKSYARLPECVVRPAAAREISEIMKLANSKRFPVTPRGEGSGLSGGAVPVYGGVVMLFNRMNRVVEYDRQTMTITVEPGLITNEINDHVRADGLFYAGYPMSLEMCSIGGNVAENAGGAKAIKYGVTGRYVIGLEVVMPTGEIVHMGGKLVKDVTGYNLIQLMVGSEGTLGIFTRIILRLMPLPRESVDLLVCFNTPEEAIAMVPAIMAAGGIIPTAVEYMDRISLNAACSYLGEKAPGEDAGAILLITVDGQERGEVERQYEKVGELCLEGGAIDVLVADTAAKSEKLWKIRKNMTEGYKALNPHMSLEDIVVPTARIPLLIKGLKEIEQRYDILIPCSGHAGDGNLHATPMKNPGWTLQEWDSKRDKILEDLYGLARSLGGTISGEHGIGHKRKKFLPMVLEPEHIQVMRAIKQALDPQMILNPGKIFE